MDPVTRFVCAACAMEIRVTLDDLLRRHSISCPSCGFGVGLPRAAGSAVRQEHAQADDVDQDSAS